MFTKMAKNDVIAIGARHRGAYLLEQYGYTMGIAKLDGEELAALAPKGFLDEVAACAEKVSEAMKNKTMAAEESRGSTVSVTRAMRRAKEWRSAAITRGKFAARGGENIPAVLLRADRLNGVPAVVKNMTDMLKMLETNFDAMNSGGLRSFIDEGQNLLDQIMSFDADQELKRLRSLPEATREFYCQKGLLYIGIKGINDWGRVLHRGDPAKGKAYDLTILYRHAGRRKPAGDDAKAAASAGGKD